MLKRRCHHDTLIIPKNILGTISVMNIEIHDCDALESIRFHRVGCPHSYVVEQAKPRRAIPLSMMSRGANTAKSVVRFLPDHEIRCEHHRAGSAISCCKAVPVHCRVRIKVRESLDGRTLRCSLQET